MRKFFIFVAVLLLLLSLIGTVHVSAEAAEEEEDEHVYALEDYSVGSIGFSAPGDWEVSFLGGTGCDLSFGQASILRLELVYDEAIGLPGQPEDAISYGEMNRMILGAAAPVSEELWQYRLNGLNVDFYYFDDAEAYEGFDLVLLVFYNSTVAGVISGELFEEDLDTYRADLLGMLMSLSAEAEEAGEETAPEGETEVTETEDMNAEEAETEEAESGEAEAGEADAGEAEETVDTGDTEEADPERAADAEDTETEDTETEDTEAEDIETEDSAAWVEKSFSGIRFLVPKDWEEEEGNEEGFFRFMFGKDSMFSVVIIPRASMEEEYASVDTFIEELDAGVKTTASMLNADVFKQYKAFNLNGINVHLFYLSRKASGGSGVSDYIRLTFAGAEGMGMISFNYLDGDPESFRPMLLGVLTSMTSDSAAEKEEDETPEEAEEFEEEFVPENEENPEGDFESEDEQQAG